MENACCNERNGYSTITYFEKENRDIAINNNHVYDLAKVLLDVNNAIKSVMFYSTINSKNTYPALGQEFNEDTIYMAFIVYCKFNSPLPINADLLPICPEKPESMSNGKQTIKERIDRLTQEGHKYNNAALLRLMQLVSRRNIVPITLDMPTFTAIQQIRDLLIDLSTKQNEIIPVKMRDLISEMLETYDPSSKEEPEQNKALINYLARENDQMRVTVTDFLKKYVKSKQKFTALEDFLRTLMTWRTTTTNDDTMYNAINFMKNFIQDIVKTFPNIIINKVDYNAVKVPDHWGLSDHHKKEMKKIIASYYVDLRAFYSIDSISNLLMKIQQKCTTLLIMSNKTYALSNIKGYHTVFNKKMCEFLFENYFLQILSEYIKLTNDPSILLANVVQEETDEDQLLMTREALEDQELRIEGVSEREGNLKEVKQRAAALLSSYLFIMSSSKQTMDVTYENIMDRIFKQKEREKDTFTDRLQALTDEERAVDNMLKINKLGVWNKGLQKGLTTYVAENYDEEREMRDRILEAERAVNKNKGVVDMNRDQFMDDYLDEQARAEDIEREDNDMRMMNSEFYEGNYGGDEFDEQDILEDES